MIYGKNNSTEVRLDVNIDKQITLPLSDYLHALLNSKSSLLKHDDPLIKDRITVDVALADLVASIDTNCQLCYVEYPDPFNGLEHPQIWNISAWRISSERLARVRAASEIERQKYHAREETIKALATAIHKDTGQDEDACEVLARFYVQKKRVGLCSLYGIDIKCIV